jgi:Kef-type K+ transport system membrane component KefB
MLSFIPPDLPFEAVLRAVEGAEEVSHGAGITLLWMAVILIAAKLSNIVERFGQPSVLGELVIGVILGNLVLLNINIFEPMKNDEFIGFLAQLGVVILLFQVGLETNISDMKQVGMNAFIVAIIGVVLPFAIGTYTVGPLLMPGLDNNAYLFLGATLCATSVGITARVFRDLGRIQDKEAQIILGAAVIDDVLALIILAVVSAIVTTGDVSGGTVALIILKAVVFLGATIAIGQALIPRLGKVFASIQKSAGMQFTVAISIGLLLAYLAEVIGLAPIVGAFAAGLVLDPGRFQHFFDDPQVVSELHHIVEHEDGDTDDCSNIKQRVREVASSHTHRQVEHVIEPISFLLVPIFFVKVGMDVSLASLFDMQILLVAIGITIAAIIGKVIAGAAAGKGANNWIVGWGMVPRGEVGLIFAATGKALGVVSDEVFSVIVIMVIFSTLLPPPILAWLIRKDEQKKVASQGA